MCARDDKISMTRNGFRPNAHCRIRHLVACAVVSKLTTSESTRPMNPKKKKKNCRPSPTAKRAGELCTCVHVRETLGPEETYVLCVCVVCHGRSPSFRTYFRAETHKTKAYPGLILEQGRCVSAVTRADGFWISRWLYNIVVSKISNDRLATMKISRDRKITRPVLDYDWRTRSAKLVLYRFEFSTNNDFRTCSVRDALS